MKTIKDNFNAEYEIKKSKFISFLYPSYDIKTLKGALQKEHPKANHIVYALRYLDENLHIVENQSDDNEPKNTSGPSCLNVLRGANIINASILVVRYFGGIKLGTGGLVKAYTNAANSVIKKAVFFDYEYKQNKELFVAFSLLSKFEYYFNCNKISTCKIFNDTGAIFKLSLTDKQLDNLLKFCSELYPKNSIKFL